MHLSSVPVRTAERIRQILDANKQRPDIHFEVISNPEFLAEVLCIG
jgi:UDPglucose 6-dehydrogenase